jgi:hypothetical protein
MATLAATFAGITDDHSHIRFQQVTVVSNLKCNSNASFFREMHGC